MDKSTLDNLNSLIQLDIFAVDAYDEVSKHIDVDDILTTFQVFRADHQRHVDTLSDIVARNGGQAAKSYPMDSPKLPDEAGTEDALKMIEADEKVANDVYGKAQDWDVPSSVHDVLEKNLDDEKHHLAYVESQLHAIA